MNFLEGRFSIRDPSRSSAFDGNSPVSLGDGVELQRKFNLLYPEKEYVYGGILSFFIG